MHIFKAMNFLVKVLDSTVSCHLLNHIIRSQLVKIIKHVRGRCVILLKECDASIKDVVDTGRSRG